MPEQLAGDLAWLGAGALFAWLGCALAQLAALAPEDSVDRAPLDTPIEEEFRAGTMTLAWDDEAQRVIVEVFAIEEDVAGPEDLVDPENEREVMVVVLPPTVARAFCERAEAVVSAGRPSCDYCGNPLDPDGHLCPRMNGFRRR